MSINSVGWDMACAADGRWYDLGNLTVYNLENSSLNEVRPTNTHFLI